MPQRSQYLSHVNDCTCSTNGAHFRGGPIRPAASTITAALHFGQQLWILVGAAPVQQAGVAIPTTSICGKRHSRKSVKLTALHGIWHVLSACWANWQEYNQKKIVVVASDFPSFGRWKPLPIVLISYLYEPFLHPAVFGTVCQHDSHSSCALT